MRNTTTSMENENYSNADLETLYLEAESVDQELFAEQRSNILLVSGEHYNKKRHDAFQQRLRDAKGVTEETKLRLVKNHMGRISGMLINNLITHSPNVTILPQIETEIQDQKSAELNLAVWRDANAKYKIRGRIRDWAQDFVELGEVATKIFYDPHQGDFLGYEQLLDEKTGEPLFDDEGNPAPNENKPVFKGGFIFEDIHGFNLLRAPGAKKMEESPYLIIRKMVDTVTLKKKYANDEKKLKAVTDCEDETYVVFDGNKNNYGKTNKETFVLEYYFRPSYQFPRGYFYIRTRSGILEQGELPLGLFPIKFKEFKKIQTSPRGRSRIKELRPYQIEINRCASAMATHQITLGDDKIITNTTGKIEQGGIQPGVRAIKVPGGGNITILPGRSGEQYLNYMAGQIAEMYEVAGLREDAEEKQLTGDPFNMLFTSVKQKKKFAIYIEKFEEFLTEVCELYLELAKAYMDDEEVIASIGRRELINMSEFRNTQKQCYQIRVEPQTEDPTTQFGKQLILNHTIQYAGSQLDKEDIGKLIKNMPFANLKEDFDDMTIDYDNARNDILALERGEQPEVNQSDNHTYILKKLTHRMKQRDFKTLRPEIQQNFLMKKQMHEQAVVQEQQALQQAQAGFIPTGGYMVKCDFYISNGKGQSHRAELPYEAISWLVKKLETQGMGQQQIANMQQSAQASLAENFNNSANVAPNAIGA